MSGYDVPAGLKGAARCRAYIQKQQKWIADCEANGRSYTGENGDAIRKADLAELRRWESELAIWLGKN